MANAVRFASSEGAEFWRAAMNEPCKRGSQDGLVHGITPAPILCEAGAVAKRVACGLGGDRLPMVLKKSS